MKKPKRTAIRKLVGDDDTVGRLDGVHRLVGRRDRLDVPLGPTGRGDFGPIDRVGLDVE